MKKSQEWHIHKGWKEKCIKDTKKVGGRNNAYNIFLYWISFETKKIA